MTDDQTPAPDPDALQRMIEMDQGVAALRSVAESAVVVRRTLVEGGFPDEAATMMAMRAWCQFFPGAQPQGPLGFLFGGQQ